VARDGSVCGDFGGLELVKEKNFTQRARRTQRSQREEILEELLTGGREDGFRVKLDAFEFVAAVAEAHDDAVVSFGGDGEFARERFALDDERMVARGSERLRQLAENILAVVMDFAGFSVKEFRCANNFSAEGSADGLMAEANA
jgi:hypothetical protein